MIYKLYIRQGQITSDAAMTANQTFSKSFLFDKNNHDYIQFKHDLANGAELQDSTGTVMTASQIQAFIATLP